MEIAVSVDVHRHTFRIGNREFVIAVGNINIIAYVCISAQIILRFIVALHRCSFIQLIDITNTRNRHMHLIEFKPDTVSSVQYDTALEIIRLQAKRNTSRRTAIRAQFLLIIKYSFAGRHINQQDTHGNRRALWFFNTDDISIRLAVVQSFITDGTRICNRAERKHSALVVKFRVLRFLWSKNRHTACVQVRPKASVVKASTVGNQNTVLSIGEARRCFVAEECHLRQVFAREIDHHIRVRAVTVATFRTVECKIRNVILNKGAVIACV